MIDEEYYPGPMWEPCEGINPKSVSFVHYTFDLPPFAEPNEIFFLLLRKENPAIAYHVIVKYVSLAYSGVGNGKALPLHDWGFDPTQPFCID